MLSLLLDAAWMTLGLALASLVGGMVLALAFSAAELSKQRWLVWPVATLTTLIRGLPELLVVLFIYFGSTQVLFLITGEYVEFSPFACGVLALSCCLRATPPRPCVPPSMRCPLGSGWRRRRSAWARGTPSFASCCPRPGVTPCPARQPVAGAAERHRPGLLIGVNEMMRQAQMASASTYQPFHLVRRCRPHLSGHQSGE